MPVARAAADLPTPPSRTEEIAAVLRDEILVGQYRAGERLPSERDLAARFGAGRGAVREALKKLEQLGVASIRPGGARVVPIEECTPDVLGPLLDLKTPPDPALVDQVIHVFGVLIAAAAEAAVAKATPERLAEARRIADEMAANKGNSARQHDQLRRLAMLWVDVADHLVLRLMINGLSTTFFTRIPKAGAPPRLDTRTYGEIARGLGRAIDERDAAAVGDSMRRLNGAIRESVSVALQRQRRTRRKSA
ncbi:MAG: FadR family transcriptional regulator [Gammaproteobacteria bacterium]|nr:FadR family transcriptional regulator [Gammaproteobacteria bacterium]